MNKELENLKIKIAQNREYTTEQINELEKKLSIIAEIIQPKDFKLHFNFREQITELRELLHGHHLELDKIALLEDHAKRYQDINKNLFDELNRDLKISLDYTTRWAKEFMNAEKILQELGEDYIGHIKQGHPMMVCLGEKGWLERLDSIKKKKSKKLYLDLGMITSKNGELFDYTPSQIVRDYAKTHILFSLYGLMFPEEKMTDDEIMLFNEELMSKINKRKIQPLDNSEGEKEDSASHIRPHSNLIEVKSADNQSENSKPSEFKFKTEKKDCNECDLYGKCDHQEAYQINGKWCYEQLENKKDDFPERTKAIKDAKIKQKKRDILKESKPEKSIGKSNSYYKGYEDCEKELIEEFLPILDAGINIAERMLAHSKKSRKGKLHNSIEDLIRENMISQRLYFKKHKEKWQEQLENED